MSYCTEKVASLPLQQELNQFQNQVQSKVNQWKGKEKTQNLLVLVNKAMINHKQKKNHFG